jgi:hypothetical protein
MILRQPTIPSRQYQVRFRSDDGAHETEQIMPLTRKGTKVLSAMRKEYGAKKGTRVFYASVNKGTVKGAERRSGGGRKR